MVSFAEVWKRGGGGSEGGGGVRGWLKEKIRETIDGWPLQTVETEANGDLWSKNESCPSLVGSLGSSCRYTRFLFCPLQNIFFLTLQTFSFYVSSSLSHLGRPVVPGRLSLNMYLWKNAQRARNKNILQNIRTVGGRGGAEQITRCYHQQGRRLKGLPHEISWHLVFARIVTK